MPNAKNRPEQAPKAIEAPQAQQAPENATAPAQAAQASQSNVTIDMISPAGVPVTLTVGLTDDASEIVALMQRADQIGNYFARHGWEFARTPATLPSPGELAQGASFGGYPCAETRNDAGFPTWIVADGQQAMRREKQGDTWYSYREASGDYITVLRIPKGETV